MEPGLGKTAVILNDHIEYKLQDRINFHTVVVPDTLKGNWMDENQEWTRGHLKFAVWPEKAKKGDDGPTILRGALCGRIIKRTPYVVEF